MDTNGILLLSDLLKEPEKESDDIESSGPKASPYQTPGAIGVQIPKDAPSNNKHQPDQTKKEIWSAEEVPTQLDRAIDDPRLVPEYDVKFKQAVTPEDVFLGMGNKTTSTASCEDLVITITLPDTEYKDIDLDVTETFLDCQTPKYRLGLHLPHPVDHRNGKAQWLSAQNVLHVSLHMSRQLDYLNF